MTPTVEEKARLALKALRELKGAVLSECGLEGPAEAVADFNLLWEDAMSASDLAEEARRVGAECSSEFKDFRSGRVYCYDCRSSACRHSRPLADGEVFAGYESTGRPRWEEFFQLLLLLEDRRTDRLFASRPDLLARVLDRSHLTGDQLVSFGRNSLTYRVWGQVVAGYLHLENMRAAITVQLVETRDRKLHLQVVTPEAVREVLANAPSGRRQAFHRVHDALAEARAQVHSLGNLWQNTRNRAVRRDLQNRLFATLRHLAHSIERKGRQQQRRTSHAEFRAEEKRPVHKAREDLATAGWDDLMLDVVRDTIVVVGRANRMHVFSREGRHITSLFIGGDELQRRRHRRRYQPMPEDQAKRFRDSALEADGL